MITLSYGGSMRVVPRYNVMGVAKAALEASVRISPSTSARTPRQWLVAGTDADACRLRRLGRARYFQLSEAAFSAPPDARLDKVGGAALYLLSDFSTAVTGEIHHVDSATISWPCPGSKAYHNGEGTAVNSGNGHHHRVVPRAAE